MPKYVITKPRFVQQLGQPEPAYVFASPSHPAVIDVAFEVPADQQVQLGYRPVEAPEPPKPKPAHAEPAAAARVKNAAEVQGRRL